MFGLGPATRIYLAAGGTDMRKGFEGLYGEFFTIEDAAKNVLAHARTLDEIALKWHQIDDQKVIVERLLRQSAGSSSRLLNFI